MADTKISALPALGTAPATDDVFAIVDTGAVTTKKVTVANVKTAVAPDTATESAEGVVELSTDGEAQTGTATNRVLTPANLQAVTGTETRKGVLELSTDAEAQTGTDTARAITPANLQAVTGTETRKGVLELSTDAEAQTGSDTARAITPANLQAVTGTETRKGVLELATTAEADTGTDTARAVTPAGVKSACTGTYDIWIPAAAMRPSVTNGCAAMQDVEMTGGRPNLQVLDFDPAADEHAQFSIAMPKSWDEGTITVTFYWTNMNAVTDSVVWQFEGLAVGDGDSIDATYGSGAVITDAFVGTAKDLAISAPTPAITIGGSPAAGELCFFQLARTGTDGSDDLATDARLIGIKMIYTTDAITDA